MGLLSESRVLKKALARGLVPLVVINKVDRDSSRVEEVEGEVFDLMCNLGATDEQVGSRDMFWPRTYMQLHCAFHTPMQLRTRSTRMAYPP